MSTFYFALTHLECATEVETKIKLKLKQSMRNKTAETVLIERFD